jgi:CubicO group peptidase (beta-lactamase class C family)
LVPFTRSQLLSQTRLTFFLPTRGSYQYSNMGGSLEGHAIAAAAGTNYKALLQNRILTPLQLAHTRILYSPNDITAATSRGTRSSDGKVMEPYAGEGYAPSATMRSTITDMSSYALKVMNNQAPGVSALTPRWAAAPGQKVGYNWFTDSEGRAWHNGKTGGFTSMLMLDKATGKGIVVLSNTDVIVDNGAIALLENPAL